MAGPDHVIGTTRLYTRQTEADAWEDRTAAAFLDSPIAQKAGGVSSLVFELRYGPGTPAGRMPVLYKHWVRVTHQPDGGAETLVWFGNIEDARLLEDTQTVQWTAVSVEAQMARIRLSESYADGYALEDTCTRIHRLKFNDELDSQGRHLTGRRSDSMYHFWPGESRQWPYDAEGPGDPLDWAYVFGVDSLWRANDILRLLLEICVPPGGNWSSPIGFYPTLSVAAQIYMEGCEEAWNFRGKTLYEAVDLLVRRAGPLMWWTDAAAYVSGATNYVHLYVASRLFADRDASIQGAHTIVTSPAEDSPALGSVIRGSMKNRVTEVIARGAPLKLMFTVDSDGESNPRYEQGWTAAQETAYEVVQESIEEDKSPWANVFTQLIVPYNQGDDTGLLSGWVAVALAPSTDSVPVGKLIDLWAIESEHYIHPRRFLPSLLTWRGWTNPTGNDGTFPTPPAGDPAQPEHDPVLCWYVPPSIGGADWVRRIRGVRVLQEQAGVRIPLRYRNPDSEAPVDLSQNDQWQNLKITVAVEWDVCLEWREPTLAWEDDQRRVEVIQLPECEWWAAREGTIIDIYDEGTEVYVYGVLRNDLPILKAAAEARSARVNQRIGGRQARPDIFAQIQLKWVSLTYGLGDFVEVYGGIEVHSPIAELVHETRDEEGYGTILITDRARRRGDKP